MTNPRHCEVCDKLFERKKGEKISRFLVRKTCSDICYSRLQAAIRIRESGGAEGDDIKIARSMPLTGQCFARHNLSLKSSGVFTAARPAPTTVFTHLSGYDSRFSADDI